MSPTPGTTRLLVITRRGITPALCALAVLLLGPQRAGAQQAGAQTQPTPEGIAPDATATAIAEWQRLRTIPQFAIDDPMGFLIHEAGAFRRLTSLIESVEADPSAPPLDPRLELAILRTQYLAASIDGIEPAYLMLQTDRAINESKVPRVRAEAAYRVLTSELMRLSSNRAWDDPLLTVEYDLLSAYLDCFGNSPRAASAVKRIADDASARRDAPALRACHGLVDDASPQHPIGAAFDAKAHAMELINRLWAPPLTTIAGSRLDWAKCRGRPTVVLIAAEAQTPSLELRRGLADMQAASVEPAYHLVVIYANVSASPSTAITDVDQLKNGLDDRLVVRLQGGWRDPLLVGLDIRSLPTALILDRQGVLRDIVRHNHWRMVESVQTAVAQISSPNVSVNQAASLTSQPAEPRQSP